MHVTLHTVESLKFLGATFVNCEKILYSFMNVVPRFPCVCKIKKERCLFIILKYLFLGGILIRFTNAEPLCY